MTRKELVPLILVNHARINGKRNIRVAQLSPKVLIGTKIQPVGLVIVFACFFEQFQKKTIKNAI